MLKKLFFTLLLAIFGVSFAHAMEVNQAESHRFPPLFWDFKGEAAVLKIASLENWRQENSYKAHKKAIEEAIIDHPESSVSYGNERFSTIILQAVMHRNFVEKEVGELFNPTTTQHRIGNHHAFMRECSENCPLARSVTNSRRTNFEDDFVARVKQRYSDTKEPLRYVGFGSGFGVLGDLRILMKLKMAGYRFQKIQFIDPVVTPWLNWMKFKILFKGAGLAFSPRDASELKGIYEANPFEYALNMNVQIFAQFLAILSNYDGDDVIEYYPNVATYLKANPAQNQKAHIITTLDLLEAVSKPHTENILGDFRALKSHNDGALVGELYANYAATNPKCEFKDNHGCFSYTLIATTNECETCKQLNAVEYCDTCEDKTVGYCSTDCQAKDRHVHDAKFHASGK